MKFVFTMILMFSGAVLLRGQENRVQSPLACLPNFAASSGCEIRLYAPNATDYAPLTALAGPLLRVSANSQFTKDFTVTPDNGTNQFKVSFSPTASLTFTGFAGGGVRGLCTDATGLIKATGCPAAWGGPGVVQADLQPGANQLTQLQNCVNALGANGGTCDARAMTGTVTVTATLNIPAKVNLMLGAITLTGNANPVVSLNGSNSSLTCQTPAATQISSTLVDNNAKGANPIGTTVYVAAGTDNVTIDRCTILSPLKTYYDQPVDEGQYKVGNPILVDGTTTQTTTNFKLRGSVVNTGNGGIVVELNEGAQITGNTFISTPNGHTMTNVWITGSNDGLISNNIFRADATAEQANAIYVRVSNFGVANAFIHGNVISGNQVTGPMWDEVFNNSRVSNESVTGNVIHYTPMAGSSQGIIFYSPAQNNTISGNTVWAEPPPSNNSCGPGIRLAGASSAAFGDSFGNVASGNTIQGWCYGIGWGGDYSYDNMLIGNVLYSPPGANKPYADGISTGGNAGGAAKNYGNKIIGNQVDGFTGNCISDLGLNVLIANNGCGQTGGIFLNQNVDHAQIFDNIVGSGGIVIFQVNAGYGTDIVLRGNKDSGGGPANWNVNPAGSATVMNGESTPQSFTGPVGFGTRTPETNWAVSVKANGTNGTHTTSDGFAQNMITTGGGGPAIRAGECSNGTIAAPTAVAQGAVCHRIDAWGYDGSAFQGIGWMQFFVDGPVTAGHTPGGIRFQTWNTAGNLVTAAAIHNDGTWDSIPAMTMNHLTLGTPLTGGLSEGQAITVYPPTGVTQNNQFITLESNNFQSIMQRTHGGSSGAVSIWQNQCSLGTAAAATAIVNGSECSRLEADGYDGTTYRPSTLLSTYIDGNVSAGAVPGQFVFTAADLTGTLHSVFQIHGSSRTLQLYGTNFAQLASISGSSFTYCTDCTVNTTPPNTCAGGGGGAWAFWNGNWKCPF
jgi:hypothetical protein